MKWRSQNLLDTSVNDVRYLVISVTKNCCSTFYNPKEIASTPSFKVSVDQSGYGSNIPPKRNGS